MIWFRFADYAWYQRLLRAGQVQPRPREPRVPLFDHVLSYATSAPDIVRSWGAYPVTLQQVRRGGHVIADARVEEFADEVALAAFGRRVDNILPGAYWGLRFV